MSGPTSGRLRVSDAVLDKLVLTSAYEVQGVVDVHGLAVGALLGGALAGTIGLVQAGPAGAALAAPLGAAAGTAVAHLAHEHQDRGRLYVVGTGPLPLKLRLTARYGTDLEALADAVRRHVAQRAEALGGLTVGPVDVEFVEIIPPTRS